MAHYNPNQPRIPAKHDGGGRWTDGVPESLSHLNAFFKNRDDDRHEGTVRLAFEGSQKLPIPTRTTPLPKPPSKPGSKLSTLLQLIWQAGQDSYSYWSQQNSENQRTILSFRSHHFRGSINKSFEYEDMRILIGDEIKEKCGEIDKIQEYVDLAFKQTEHLKGAERGKAVHKLVEKWIKKDSEDDESKFKNTKVEITFAKEDSETEDDRTNAKNTVRIDVFTQVDDKTVCVHDIKTSYKGLSYKRMQELLGAVSRSYPGIEQVFMTEVFPTGVPFPRGRRRPLKRD